MGGKKWGRKKKKKKREGGLSADFLLTLFALLEYWNFLSISLGIAVLSLFNY